MTIKGFLARKMSMTQAWDKAGNLVPVTVLKADPCFVTEVKKINQELRLQLISSGKQRKRLTKPLKGILKKAGIKDNFFKMAEVRADEEVKIGQEVKIDQVLKPGDLVNISGLSKGRGFAGVIKRWGFQSQPKTHGQSDRERAPGSIGAQTPGRVIKGKKMPGHFGNQQVTIKNLLVLNVDKNKNEVLVKGAVPGYYSSWLLIKKIGAKKNFLGLREEKQDEIKEKN